MVLSEQFAGTLGLRFPFLLNVLGEELTGCVLRVLEALETLAAFLSDLHGGADCVVGDGVEVHVGEVQRFFGTVVDVLACQVAVQVHLAQTHGVAHVVAALDGGYGADVGLVRDGGQRTNRGFHGLAEVVAVHGQCNVQRTEVAGDVLTDGLVAEVSVVGGRLRNLQDLGAQVGHDDLTGDGVRAVDGVFEHHVRVAGLKLDLCDGLEELTRVDLGLGDACIVDHLVVLLGDVDVGEGHAVDAFHIVRGEEVHVLVLLRQLEGDVGDDNAQGEGLDANLLVSVLTLGVQERVDVGVVCVQVHGTGTLTCAELVCVGEGVFQQLHDGDNARGLVLNLLNGRTGFAQVGQGECHAAAALGELQCRVDGATDGLHVVFHAQQEAGDELAALLLTCVEEGRGCRLETTGDDLVDDVFGELLVAFCQQQCDHADAVFKTLQVALTVEGLERVGGVELEGTQEGREAELHGVGTLEQVLNELEVVLVEEFRLVVLVLDQVLDLLFQVVEEDGVVVDVLQEVLTCSLTVCIELNLAVLIVEVQQCVQLVVAHTLELLGHALAAVARTESF